MNKYVVIAMNRENCNLCNPTTTVTPKPPVKIYVCEKCWENRFKQVHSIGELRR